MAGELVDAARSLVAALERGDAAGAFPGWDAADEWVARRRLPQAEELAGSLAE